MSCLTTPEHETRRFAEIKLDIDFLNTLIIVQKEAVVSTSQLSEMPDESTSMAYGFLNCAMPDKYGGN